jgi:glycosyltransferase involved in cell wall biosynthesis
LEVSVDLVLDARTATDLSPFTLRQQWDVPRLLHRRKATLYHSPYYLMPYRSGVPALVTIHDLIPLLYPEYFSLLQRLVFAVTVRLAARVARWVIADSQATAGDLRRFLNLPQACVVVVPAAADPAFYPRPPAEVEAARRKYGLPESYVLYLASNKPHKNLVRLVEAWARLQPQPLPLVIAGVWDPRFPEPRERAQALGLGERVLWPGPVAELDLSALYTGATIFAFPSVYEGFGLPVLEAMACGTPVVCSNTSSLAEVAGDAALTVDPIDTVAIADALGHLLSDADLRADLRERGLRQAARFSWTRAARETLEVYRRVYLP